MIKPCKLIAGNWKINGLLEEGRTLAGELRRRLDGADHLTPTGDRRSNSSASPRAGSEAPPRKRSLPGEGSSPMLSSIRAACPARDRAGLRPTARTLPLCSRLNGSPKTGCVGLPVLIEEEMRCIDASS
jgi:hypothetical protein